MTLTVDVHEPAEAISLMSQSVTVAQRSLNTDGFADYIWYDSQNRLVQVERKQWGEILGGMDKVEDQLRRHLTNQKGCKLTLLIEGMYIQSSIGTTILKESKSGWWTPGHSSTIRMSQVYAWLYGLSQYIQVFQTTNYEGTCTALVSMYKYDQKVEKEHHTFQRHYKQMTFNPNPQITQVMGMMPGIGEVRAAALVERFTTVYNIVNAKPTELSEIPGIGAKLSKQILQRVGRVDV